MGGEQEIVVPLNISSEDFLAYYKGAVKYVMATASDGRRVRFPANILQRFLTAEGVSGVFVLRYDAANRFKEIRRLQG